MSNRVLLPLAVLLGIVFGAVAFRPMPMANAQQGRSGSPDKAIIRELEPEKLAPAEVAKPVAKWEYKTIYSTLTKDLNAVAADGYELVFVTVAANQGDTHPTAIFKRPAK